ncbi:MAG: AAA family ATPase [Desulfobacula sp.]|nr:AAA family ATPase [Desulfobacula sp.]
MKTYIPFEIESLYKYDVVSDLEYFFARSMALAFNETNPLVQVACALVSKSLSEGHVCLDLASTAGTQKPLSETNPLVLKYPDAEHWIEALKESSMVSEGLHTPLVLDSAGKLYLARYYDFQNRLADNISRRVSLSKVSMEESLTEDILKDFFPGGNHLLPQKNAVKNALCNKFTLISGGPGTGKTFVIGIIKTVLPLLSKKMGQPIPRILCVAPTGKAASKMEEGSTIHSALKPLVHGPGFYFNQKNPLNADVLIIDESSMIDLPLLVRLLEAAPLETRIIMTGDKHQLTSIQAGAVFSDLCAIDELSPHTFILDYNFRSRGKTGIEKLSKAINERNILDFESLLLSHDYPDLVFEGYQDTKSVMATLQNHITKEYGPFGNAKNEEEALSKLDDFRVLCAHNKGDFGTLQINHLCEKILRSMNYSGIENRPFIKAVMVNSNDYKRGLFNGDTGVVVEKNGKTTAFFKGLDNKLKQYRYSDLPSHETAFAITIHKSQGSEFDAVLMVIPDRFSPVVTRQLLYTGVTRAKKKVILIGNLDIMKAAIRMNTKRHSGIQEYLGKKIESNYLENK